MSDPTISLFMHGRALKRLSRLFHACDKSNVGALAHIGLSVRRDGLRFMASDGQVLAIVQVETAQDPETPSPDLDLVLQCGQFTNAMAELAVGLSSRSEVRIEIDREAQEVRFSTKHAAHLVRLCQGPYPGIDGFLARHTQGAWIPSLSSFDPKLIQRAAKIAAIKGALLLSSPVPIGSVLPQVWSPDPNAESITVDLDLVRQATQAPGFWTDGVLLLLVMPMSRKAVMPITLQEWMTSSPLGRGATAA